MAGRMFEDESDLAIAIIQGMKAEVLRVSMR
jgi:hypothetical protein